MNPLTHIQSKLHYLCIILFLHCSNNHQNTGNDQLVYAFKRSQDTGRFLYSVHNNITTTFEINDKEYSTNNTANINFSYVLNKDSAGNNKLSITYDQIQVSLKDKDNNITELSTAKADISTDPVERILSTIKGGTIQITMDSVRNIQLITGIKELSDKVLKSLPTQNAIVQDQVKSLILKLIGEEFVRDNLQQTFQLFPDSVITVGQTWKRPAKSPGEINMIAESTYKLESIHNGIAHVTSKSAFEGDENNKVFVMGRPTVLENMKGSQKEEFSIVTETGMLTHSKSHTNISGRILVRTNQIPLTITTTKEIKGRKLPST